MRAKSYVFSDLSNPCHCLCVHVRVFVTQHSDLQVGTTILAATF